MREFFTADYHLGHYNIIKYTNRPFSSVEEMDKKIIANCNQRTKENDIVYDLGDHCLYGNKKTGNGEETRASEYIKQLNAQRIFLEGNHDRGNRNTLKTKNQEIIINQNGLRIQLLHDPLYSRIDYDLILCGHVHNAWKLKELYYCGQIKLMINVGVDVWNFYPVRLDEILSVYYSWKKERSKIKRWNQPDIIKELNKGTLSEN